MTQDERHSSDSLEVATGGSINRNEHCCECSKTMLYRVDFEGRVTESFCGNADCHLFLVEIQE